MANNATIPCFALPCEHSLLILMHQAMSKSYVTPASETIWLTAVLQAQAKTDITEMQGPKYSTLDGTATVASKQGVLQLHYSGVPDPLSPWLEHEDLVATQNQSNV